MVNLIFVRLPDGKRYEVSAASGQSLLEAATEHNIPRIIGECGGACSCGTCHVYAEAAGRLPPPGAMEEDMLAFTDKTKPSSRLACQISVTEALEGMVFYLP